MTLPDGMTVVTMSVRPQPRLIRSTMSRTECEGYLCEVVHPPQGMRVEVRLDGRLLGHR